MIRIELTDRAHFDLQAIESYSIANFGEKVAEKYINDIEAALLLLQECPQLLKQKTNISDFFSFYRVRQHFLICTQIDNSIFVLSIKHVSMDIPNRIAELEPTLLLETQQLHKTLKLTKRLD
ncbi:MAG: hypothetical protein GQ569_14505 [Methylococcaceae bacterium]|nr:hypothetical protein [Methylococcaceae bacterium]